MEQTIFSKRELGQYMTINSTLKKYMLNQVNHLPRKFTALEPAAGTGELVLDLEEAGFTVDAFDLFPPSETVCSNKIVEKNAFDIKGQYGLIYANPPYGWTNNPDAPYPVKFIPKKFQEIYGEAYNVYMPFLHHMVSLLKKNGLLVVVCPTVLFKHPAAEPLMRVFDNEGEMVGFDVMGPCSDFFYDANDIELCVFSWQKHSH